MEEAFPAFSPRMVEQQIKDYLQLPVDEDNTHHSHVQGREMVHNLQSYYSPVDDHHAALQRVWLRFLTQQQMMELRPAQNPLSPARIIHLARRRKNRWLQIFAISPRLAGLARYLGIAAIIMALALALGRLVYVLAKHDSHSSVFLSTSDNA